MGRTPQTVTKYFESPYNGQVQKEVELFTWEKLDLLKTFKTLFNIISPGTITETTYVPYKVKDIAIADWGKKRN